MRILLTGSNGQVGHELKRSLAALPDVEVVAVDLPECNLADIEATRKLVRDVRPNLIVNPAAYTAVDKAESDVQLATAINADAPGILGEEAARIGAWVIHYSTDYVFDGTATAPYAETDATNPRSVYGKTKHAGELALQASGAQYLIFRTSWVVGAHGGNFAKTMLRLAAEKESLNVVADQFGAPTSAALLADVTAKAIEQEQADGADGFPFGLYHVVAGGETNWCEYARFVVAAGHAAGLELKLQPQDIKGISTAEYPLPAPRPASSRLATDKFRSTFGLPLPDWRDGVQQVLDRIFAS